MKAMGVVLLMAVMVAGARAERVPIPRSLIEAAVARAVAGVNVAAIEVPAQPVAGRADPRLTVELVRVDASRRWIEARLRCEPKPVCVPFYVTAEMGPARTAVPLMVSVPPVRPPQWLVRAGGNATLVVANDRTRLTMPVKCRENGARGQRVRVEAPGGVSYEAEVTGPGQLRAESTR